MHTRPGGRWLIAALLLMMTFGTAPAADKLPPEKAGQIGQPTGKIAFVRSGNLWVMNANGTGQMKVSEVGNADGRISWAPDNRRLIFTRSGKVSLKSPDNLGGVHKVYDLFMAYLDSAEAGNTFWWHRLTDDLGSRDPEWGYDGTITFVKDLNANTVNAVLPNYQICTMTEDGDDLQILRKDWQVVSHFFISPTVSPDGRYAFVMLDPKSGPIGLVVLPKEEIMTPVETLVVRAERMRGRVAPSWSPDGKWLAYVVNSLTEGGLYITTPDLKQHYLVFEPPVGVSVTTMTPSWSPDGKWLTFATTDGSVWICDIAGQKPRRISGPGTDKSPAWSKRPPR